MSTSAHVLPATVAETVTLISMSVLAVLVSAEHAP